MGKLRIGLIVGVVVFGFSLVCAAADAGGIKLFNGTDLSGWEAEGGARWWVEDGMLIGTQGENGAAGDLFTVDEYDNYVLTVVYKCVWPVNSGIWFRYLSPQEGYQADILDYKNPVAHSGTIYSPGKMFLEANLDPTIENKEGWNTMVIIANGDHLIVTLNGEKTADVRDDSYSTGKVGIQVHAGDEFKDSKVMIKGATLIPLPAE